jgi:Tol biopolymer transport system component
MTAALAAVAAWWAGSTRRAEQQTGTSALTRVTWHAGLSIEPALSPDGSLVAYASNAGGGGDLELWVQRLGGGTPVQVTNNDVDDREPVFSPDGLTIAVPNARAAAFT